jgi:hypothetical protein
MEQAVISIDGHTFGKTYIPDEFTEKFAELIVLETLDQVNENMELTWIEGEVKIKEHFGVK